MNKILIAEDEAPIANLIRTVLTDAGYRCVWASDGTQASMDMSCWNIAGSWRCRPFSSPPKQRWRTG